MAWLVAAFSRTFDVSAVDQLVLALLTFLATFFVLFSLNIKRSITWKVNFLFNRTARVLAPYSDNQYSERATHFAEEKNLLSRELVRKYLPKIFLSTCRSYEKAINKKPENVIIIIDSGTTLAPAFAEIKRRGVPSNIAVNADKIIVYTNSMSGINEFNMGSMLGNFSDGNLYLFGGNPLARYRATTGKETEDEIERLARKSIELSTVIIGVLTANWISVGPGYDELHLCAKGPGHLEFKDAVQRHSHCVIVVSPLGKLLCDRDTSEINKIMNSIGEETYKSVQLRSEKIKVGNAHEMDKEVLLLTTYRRHGRALLRVHSDRLLSAHRDFSTTYKLADCKGGIQFTPKGSYREQQRIEVPHDYIWEKRGVLLNMTE